MLQTPRATRGMVVAPHHLAAQAGLGVLREGGNAIEAMVAAAAAIAVVYPHMNALGGDNFWLIDSGDGAPITIDACGAAAPPGKRMGHAGAIVLGDKGTYAAKRDALETAGATVVATPTEIAPALKAMLG